MIFNLKPGNEHVEVESGQMQYLPESYGDGSISEGIARSTISRTSLESDLPSIVFSGGATNADWKDAVLLLNWI